MELLRWMSGLTYCKFDGKHYVLKRGPIGSGATGEIAIIYMEEFQLRAVETSPYPLDQWYWYVDGSELKCKEEESEGVLEHLNNIKPRVIVFTKEDKKDDVLRVLDLKQGVDRKTKQVECMLHYKKTHELKNVDMFVANGYGRKVVKQYMKKNDRGEREIDEHSTEERWLYRISAKWDWLWNILFKRHSNQERKSKN